MGKRKDRRERTNRPEGTTRTKMAKGSDLSPLVLRLAIGPMMFTHGYNKVFGAGGLEGTERWFHGIGFRPAAVHARMAAATEMGAGALITVGALNPLPSAGVIGIMTVAARSDHKDNGFFMFKNGWEYVGFVGATAVALAAAGNGRWSVDHLMGRDRKGLRPALLAAALGIGNAALVLKTSYKPEAAAAEAEAKTAAQESSATDETPAAEEPATTDAASGADVSSNGTSEATSAGVTSSDN